jgi:hypothetical protein
MRGYVVRKWPLSGRSRFVYWNITRVSLWLLRTCISCKARKEPAYGQDRVFVPTLPRDLPDLKTRIIAAVKNINAPMLTRVRQEIEYRIYVCCVTPGAHIELL